MSARKWRVWRGRLRTGESVWIALSPVESRFDVRHFPTHAEALAYAVEQAGGGSVTPDEIAEDAFWGAQQQDETCRHIAAAIEDAMQAERRRIAAAIEERIEEFRSHRRITRRYDLHTGTVEGLQIALSITQREGRARNG